MKFKNLFTGGVGGGLAEVDDFPDLGDFAFLGDLALDDLRFRSKAKCASPASLASGYFGEEVARIADGATDRAIRVAAAASSFMAKLVAIWMYSAPASSAVDQCSALQSRIMNASQLAFSTCFLN